MRSVRLRSTLISTDQIVWCSRAQLNLCISCLITRKTNWKFDSDSRKLPHQLTLVCQYFCSTACFCFCVCLENSRYKSWWMNTALTVNEGSVKFADSAQSSQVNVQSGISFEISVNSNCTMDTWKNTEKIKSKIDEPYWNGLQTISLLFTVTSTHPNNQKKG